MDVEHLYGLLMLAKELRGHPGMANSLELINRQLREQEEEARISVEGPDAKSEPKPVEEEKSVDIPEKPTGVVDKTQEEQKQQAEDRRKAAEKNLSTTAGIDRR